VDALSYVLIPSRFGTLGLIWQETSHGPRVSRIYLPNDLPPAFPYVRPASCPPIAELAARMEAYLAGQPVTLDLNLLSLEQCGEFQRRVLLAEYGIPRGSVSTYGRVAADLQAPRAARAVGTALGRNPFPIVIPCHRAVRSDGALGGYRGGLPMKRALLEMEGIEFGPDGKVRVAEFYY
jgi:methylated-DNA-[protein]-cysteine S-methyltransferase